MPDIDVGCSIYCAQLMVTLVSHSCCYGCRKHCYDVMVRIALNNLRATGRQLLGLYGITQCYPLPCSEISCNVK